MMPCVRHRARIRMHALQKRRRAGASYTQRHPLIIGIRCTPYHNLPRIPYTGRHVPNQTSTLVRRIGARASKPCKPGRPGKSGKQTQGKCGKLLLLQEPPHEVDNVRVHEGLAEAIPCASETVWAQSARARASVHERTRTARHGFPPSTRRSASFGARASTLETLPPPRVPQSPKSLRLARADK